MASSFAKFLSFVLVLLTLNARSTLEAGGEFNYITGSDKGPEKWGDLKPEWEKCKTGSMQSPIDISPNNVEKVTSIGSLTRNYKPAGASITVSHYVEMEWEGDAGFIELDKTNNHNLANVHWHAPSEHTINGVRYDMEMHMVHKSTNPNVVFAYLYRFGSPDPFLNTLISNIARLNETSNAINLGTVNPDTVTSYGSTKYRYKGSITTPPCLEDVTWIVDSNIRSVSNEQVQTIRAAHGDKGEGNARPLQAINNRKIIDGPFS